jgi:hypothetical protein
MLDNPGGAFAGEKNPTISSGVYWRRGRICLKLFDGARGIVDQTWAKSVFLKWNNDSTRGLFVSVRGVRFQDGTMTGMYGVLAGKLVLCVLLVWFSSECVQNEPK